MSLLHLIEFLDEVGQVSSRVKLIEVTAGQVFAQTLLEGLVELVCHSCFQFEGCGRGVLCLHNLCLVLEKHFILQFVEHLPSLVQRLGVQFIRGKAVHGAVLMLRCGFIDLGRLSAPH